MVRIMINYGVFVEQLPIELNGRKVYAGFWKRFWAGIVDILVSIPFLMIFNYLESLSLAIAMFIAILSGVFFQVYTIYFHYKFGATLGKMASGIRVTQPNGDFINLRQALLRSSVDICFSSFAVIAEAVAISNANPDQYLNAGWLERGNYLFLLYPAWYRTLTILSNVWYWSEFVVLLFNKRKRAIHDFIADTVVIDSSYAKTHKLG